MVNIEKLQKSDIGKTVWYKSHDGYEFGILKSWNDKYIFVVYPGDNDAKKEHWDRYTAAATKPEDLHWEVNGVIVDAI